MDNLESLLPSLITLAAGVFGSLFGFLGGITTAKISARTQLQQTIVQEQFKFRVEAYQNALNSHIALVSSDYSDEDFGAFLAATNTAAMMSSPTTSAQIMIWQDFVKNAPSGDAAKSALASAFLAMQHDLDNFTEPRIQKTKWVKKLRLQTDMLKPSQPANTR